MYLNDVLEGGETVFFRTQGGWNVELQNKIVEENSADKYPDLIAYVAKPEKGKAVIFFPTLQPPSGIVPDVWKEPHQAVWDCAGYGFDMNHYTTEDAVHAGEVVVDPKELCTCWIWPRGVQPPPD